MSELKRLSPQQSRRVNALIRKECCNCFDGNCILLDDGESCVCPQLISYSLLCKWFRAAVLPLDKLLFAELYQSEDKRRCSVCGAAFASTSNNVKYCPDCRKYITRRQAAERMRKSAPLLRSRGFQRLYFKGFQTRKARGKGFIPFTLKRRSTP